MPVINWHCVLMEPGLSSVRYVYSDNPTIWQWTFNWLIKNFQQLIYQLAKKWLIFKVFWSISPSTFEERYLCWKAFITNLSFLALLPKWKYLYPILCKFLKFYIILNFMFWCWKMYTLDRSRVPETLCARSFRVKTKTFFSKKAQFFRRGKIS